MKCTVPKRNSHFAAEKLMLGRRNFPFAGPQTPSFQVLWPFDLPTHCAILSGMPFRYQIRHPKKVISYSNRSHMGVSKNRGVLPQIIHFNRVFPYKPSILGYPYFWVNTHMPYIWNMYPYIWLANPSMANASINIPHPIQGGPRADRYKWSDMGPL